MYKVILKINKYALIDLGYQYVVATEYDEKALIGTQWQHGTYFAHWNESEIEKARMLAKAIDFFRVKVEEEYISRSRLEEIATDALHGLIEDDKESATEFFDTEIELTDYEREYFGIETESEED